MPRTAKTLTAQSNAQLDTAQAKFGTASYLSDHTGPTRVTTPDHADFAFGSSDFTIELFARFINVGTSNGVLVHQWGGAGNRAFNWQFVSSTTPDTIDFNYSTDGTATTTASFSGNNAADTWFHFALSRSGVDLKMFKDGTQYGSTYNIGTDSIYNSTLDFAVGGIVSVAEGFDGWVDEVRVSSNARYTANFTAPSAEFSNDANTVLLMHCNGDDASTTFLDDATDPAVIQDIIHAGGVIPFPR